MSTEDQRDRAILEQHYKEAISKLIQTEQEIYRSGRIDIRAVSMWSLYLNGALPEDLKNLYLDQRSRVQSIRIMMNQEE